MLQYAVSSLKIKKRQVNILDSHNEDLSNIQSNSQRNNQVEKIGFLKKLKIIYKLYVKAKAFRKISNPVIIFGRTPWAFLLTSFLVLILKNKPFLKCVSVPFEVKSLDAKFWQPDSSFIFVGLETDSLDDLCGLIYSVKINQGSVCAVFGKKFSLWYKTMDNPRREYYITPMFDPRPDLNDVILPTDRLSKAIREVLSCLDEVEINGYLGIGYSEPIADILRLGHEIENHLMVFVDSFRLFGKGRQNWSQIRKEILVEIRRITVQALDEAVEEEVLFFDPKDPEAETASKPKILVIDSRGLPLDRKILFSKPKNLYPVVFVKGDIWGGTHPIIWIFARCDINLDRIMDESGIEPFSWSHLSVIIRTEDITPRGNRIQNGNEKRALSALKSVNYFEVLKD